jgi:PAS domain S-box-containing protein
MSNQDSSLPLETLVEIVDDGLFVLDADGRIVWGSAALADLTGIDDVDECGHRLTSLLGDDSGNADLETIESSADPTPVTIRTGSGEDRPCEITLRRCPDDRYVGSIRDISSRRRRERELDQCRTVLDAVEDAIYVTNENREFTWLNAAADRMCGVDRDADLGRHLFEFLDEDQIEIAKQNVEYLLSDETPDTITFEMEVARKDGTRFPAETRATLLPGDGFSGTAGIIRDVSDRKERKRELERKNERLQAFADTISHDLRNPLNVAMGQLGLARNEEDDPHLQAVGRALERMDDLIEELLTLTRQGRRIDDTRPVEIASVATAAWDTAATAEAELNVEADSTIEADPTRFREVLENLFRNSVEHGSTGSEERSSSGNRPEAGDSRTESGDAVEHAQPTVTVSVGELDGTPGFYVEDDGRGIPPAERERVLEAGYTTDAGSTGYGLNIVEEIADAHGWTLAIREGDDGGARFEFSPDAEA